MKKILRQLIGILSHCLQSFIHPRWLAEFRPSTVSSHLQKKIASSSPTPVFNSTKYQQKRKRNFPNMKFVTTGSKPDSTIGFCISSWHPHWNYPPQNITNSHLAMLYIPKEETHLDQPQCFRLPSLLVSGCQTWIIFMTPLNSLKLSGTDPNWISNLVYLKWHLDFL